MPRLSAPPPDPESDPRSRLRHETPRRCRRVGTRPAAGSESGNLFPQRWQKRPSFPVAGRAFHSAPWWLIATTSALPWIEVLRQPLPAFEIIALQQRGFERVAGRPVVATRLEHESHGAGDVFRLCGIRTARAIDRRDIRPVATHAIVQ